MWSPAQVVMAAPRTFPLLRLRPQPHALTDGFSIAGDGPASAKSRAAKRSKDRAVGMSFP